MNTKKTTLRSFLLGDIWATDFLTRHVRLLSLVLALVIFYIHNRYACQKELLEIDKLQKELVDVRYEALTLGSELMERSRQSRIEEYISTTGSDLQAPTNPPYLIK